MFKGGNYLSESGESSITSGQYSSDEECDHDKKMNRTVSTSDENDSDQTNLMCDESRSEGGGYADPTECTTASTKIVRKTIQRTLELELGGGGLGTLSESGSHSGGASVADDDSHKIKSKSAKKRAAITKEDQLLKRTQWAVYFIFGLASLFLIIATYQYVSTDYKDKAHQQYSALLTRLQDDVEYWSTTVTQALESESQDWTSFGLPYQEWPFVTIPHFEVRASHLRTVTLTEMVAMTPIVRSPQKQAWETYSVEHHHEWLQDANYTHDISNTIFRIPNSNTQDAPLYMPIWQISPTPVDIRIVNYDLLSQPQLLRPLAKLQETGTVVATDLINVQALAMATGSQATTASAERSSLLLQPVYDVLPGDATTQDPSLSAVIVAVLNWDRLIEHIMPVNATPGLVYMVENTCGHNLAYQTVKQSTEAAINATGSTSTMIYIGTGDGKEWKYQGNSVQMPLFPAAAVEEAGDKQQWDCRYSLMVIPTAEYLNGTEDLTTPLAWTALVAFALAIIGAVFGAYVALIQRHQKKVHKMADKANRVISSLFPQQVHDRLLEEDESESDDGKKKKKGKKNGSNNTGEGPLMAQGEAQDDGATPAYLQSKPIADLFPACTVLFADIVGFTAWSSTREPSQVFQLLEGIYHTFDQLAKQRKVFKVETIGDCYVAVTGLPVKRYDHAEAMCRFARDCLYAIETVTKRLEVALGPDTSDLNLRFGLHSGPVTAGVLRGERSRFQLFGDTVNTAARMESNGKPGQIHISEETSAVLAAHGKSHWFTKREDMVKVKGKGYLQTYWLQAAKLKHSGSNGDFTTRSGSSDNSERNAIMESIGGPLLSGKANKGAAGYVISEKQQRLIDWNVEVIVRFLKQITAHRKRYRVQKAEIPEATMAAKEVRVVYEVKEIIPMPKNADDGANFEINPASILLKDEVIQQVTDYVTTISTRYNDNPFHNFEHASHVTSSVLKLLSRIVKPKSGLEGEDAEKLVRNSTTKKGESAVGENSFAYGISADPLTQFAVVFAALIHDVDHLGVSNAQLVNENHRLSQIYDKTSVAEQNSVNLAWDILMDPQYTDFRNCIFTNPEEYRRFRALVVNSVMATDIVDKDLKTLRNARWAKAFAEREDKSSQGDASTSSAASEVTKEDIDRKATIVIEHLIQASDIAHTMQHWQVYQKWNHRLFRELHAAFKNGRLEKDPCDFWYQGEIGFYDFYIIPLAKKLADCGVFGVSSDEYLNFAISNRNQWEKQGMEVVEELKRSVEEEELKRAVEEGNEDEANADEDDAVGLEIS